jgi:hypothetical protein
MKTFITQVTLACILFLTLGTGYVQGQATVTTDKPDYAPRSNAVFTGAGFAPGETVQLKVKNLFRACNTVTSIHRICPGRVTADAAGGFVTTGLFVIVWVIL